MHPKVLVVGVGAIGGVVATHLAQAGVHPYLLITNDAIARSWEQGVQAADGTTVQLPRAHLLRSLGGTDERFDIVLIAVPATEVARVAGSLAPLLTEKGQVVTLSNGLCDEDVGAAVGTGRAVGAVVLWGARMPEPGRYVRTSKGGFCIGTLPGTPVRDLSPVTSLLELVGPVQITENLMGARFTKLAFNSVISTLGTIGGANLGTLLRQRRCRTLALRIVSEAASVAAAEGIHLEPLTGLSIPWLAAYAGPSPQGSLARPTAGRGRVMLRHAALLLVGARYRKLRSSMLAAIERGREPPVDHLNGEIVTRGRRHGVATPVNEAAVALVWRIARGERQAGPDALETLFQVAPAEPHR